jgi:hypothetical protein
MTLTIGYNSWEHGWLSCQILSFRNFLSVPNRIPSFVLLLSARWVASGLRRSQNTCASLSVAAWRTRWVPYLSLFALALQHEMRLPDIKSAQMYYQSVSNFVISDLLLSLTLPHYFSLHCTVRHSTELHCQDPYVRKTAAVCVAKLYDISPGTFIHLGYLSFKRDWLRKQE